MYLSVYYQNVRGVKTKTLDIHNTILCYNLDIICFTGTWLDETVLSSELFDDRYCVVRTDRDGKFRSRVETTMVEACSFNLFNRDWKSEYLEDLWIH